MRKYLYMTIGSLVTKEAKMDDKKSIGRIYKGFWIEPHEKQFDIAGSVKTRTLTLWRVLAGRKGGPVVYKNLKSEEEAQLLVDDKTQASDK